MKNKKLVIIITALISVVVICIAITSVFLLSPSASYTRSVKEAEHLVATGDYENAILEYQEAIEKDPENVSAYLGLAEIYEMNGDLLLAIDVLEEGYSRTRSAQLRVMLNRLVEEDETVEEVNGLSMNRTLLSMFSSYREEDYEERYGRSDGRRDARFDGLDAEIRFDEDGIPIEIHLDDILTLFDRSEPIPVEELEEMRLEGYRTTNSASHGEMVVFESSGTEVTIALKDDQVTSDSYNVIVPLAIEKEEEEVEEEQEAEQVEVEDEETVSAENTDMRVFTGQTVDIDTGASIGDVTIKIYKGSIQYGSVIQEVTSDSNGNFTFSIEKNMNCYALLEKGDYTCELNLTTSFFTEGADLGSVRLHKASEEIEIVMEKSVGLDSVTSTFGCAGDWIGLEEGTSWLFNGEKVSYKYEVNNGNKVQDILRIFNRKSPCSYRLNFKEGFVPSEGDIRVILRVPGQTEQIFTPEYGRACRYWLLVLFSLEGNIEIENEYY